MTAFEMQTRKGDGGLFDSLFGWAEQLRRQDRYPFGLEELIVSVERVLRDIDDEDVEKQSTRIIGFWFELTSALPPGDHGDSGDLTNTPTSASGDENSLHAFQVGALAVLEALSHWTGPNSKTEVLKAISLLTPAPPLDWKPSATDAVSTLSSPDFAKVLQEFSALTASISTSDIKLVLDDLKVAINDSDSNTSEEMLAILKNIQLDYVSTASGDDATPRKTHAAFNTAASRIDDKFIWDITVRFPGSEFDGEHISYLLWALSAGLNQIDGVSVEIDEWGTGSLWARFKVRIASVWARDDLQEVLGRAREAAEAELIEKRIEGVRKLTGEGNVLDEQTRKLRLENDSYETPEEREERKQHGRESAELDLESQRLDNEAKTIANAKAKIELIERTSQLLASGFVKVDNVELNINSLLYMLIEGKQVTKGPHMKVISDHGVTLKPDDVPEIEKDI